MAIAVVLAVVGMVGSTAAAAPAARRPLTTLVLGDSTGVFLTFALGDWAGRTGAIKVSSAALMGCGLVTGGTEIASGVERGFAQTCAKWAAVWAFWVAVLRPDVVVVATSFHDITDRRLTPDGPLGHIGEPRYELALRFTYDYAARLLDASRAKVMWLDSPPFAESDVAAGGTDVHPMNEPARADRFNAMLRDVVSHHPRQRVLPYAAFMAAQPGGPVDRTIRPDGVHVDGAGRAIVGNWLGPTIVAAARR